MVRRLAEIVNDFYPLTIFAKGSEYGVACLFDYDFVSWPSILFQRNMDRNQYKLRRLKSFSFRVLTQCFKARQKLLSLFLSLNKETPVDTNPVKTAAVIVS